MIQASDLLVQQHLLKARPAVARKILPGSCGKVSLGSEVRKLYAFSEPRFKIKGAQVDERDTGFGKVSILSFALSEVFYVCACSDLFFRNRLVRNSKDHPAVVYSPTQTCPSTTTPRAYVEPSAIRKSRAKPYHRTRSRQRSATTCTLAAHYGKATNSSSL